MKYAYSRAVYPPGMIIPISLSSIDQEKSIKVRAEIDTGAGITSIPETAAQELKLTPFNTVEARGAFDE